MTPGETLKALRLRQRPRLTQAQLAEAVGLDRSWLNQMERGKRPIGPEPRAKLAAYFEVSPLEFGGEAPEDPEEYRSLRDLLAKLAEADIQIQANQDKALRVQNRMLRQLREIRAALETHGNAQQGGPKQREQSG